MKSCFKKLIALDLSTLSKFTHRLPLLRKIWKSKAKLQTLTVWKLKNIFLFSKFMNLWKIMFWNLATTESLSGESMIKNKSIAKNSSQWSIKIFLSAKKSNLSLPASSNNFQTKAPSSYLSWSPLTALNFLTKKYIQALTHFIPL